jgi:integrative and conjugative element protein (TIGR02256 family)
MALPSWDESGSVTAEPDIAYFDHRHQMPGGNLCLFQRETRAIPGGDVLYGTDILRRAEQWFLGHHTGVWPPDTVESELEAHFERVSDVLVGEPFFTEDLDGFGRMFFVWDIRRRWEGQHNDIGPLVLVGLTREDGIVRPIDARGVLARLYPWIDENVWELAAKPDSATDMDRFVRIGHWWSIPKEPFPFRNGEGFLRALDSAANGTTAWEMVRSSLGSELTVSTDHFLALQYPGRRGDPEWLVLWMPRPDNNKKVGGGVLLRSDDESRRAFENSRVGVIRVHRLAPQVLQGRNRGVVSIDELREKRVALIGLGALGSQVAELLAKAGITRLRLCDSDHLATGNVARHIGSIHEFGARKTNVVIRRLLEVNPYLEFSAQDVVNASAVASLDGLRRFLDGVDLTICTTADENVEATVNQIAVIERHTVLYGRALRRGKMGRVFLVRPGQDACKACLAGYVHASRSGEVVPTDLVDIREDPSDVLYHECGRPVIAGSGVDLSFVATLTARIALDFLEDNVGEENHWIWTGQPALDVDTRLDRAFTTVVGSIARRAGCGACEEPEVAEVLLAQAAEATIKAECLRSLDAETGGILIGYVDAERRAVVLRATEPGPKATRSRTEFRRDVEFVQGELDRATGELGQRGVYLGEWHSHLVPEPEPSPTDIDSLLGISNAMNYLTRCPVMIIAGVDPKARQVRSLRSWAFPVGGRIYDVPIRVAVLDELRAGE